MRPIQTEHLDLHPLSDFDRDAVVEILQNDTVKKTYMVPDITSKEIGDRLFQRLKECSLSEGHYGVRPGGGGGSGGRL